MHRFLASLIILFLWNASPVSGVDLDLLRSSVRVPVSTVWHMASQSNVVFACAVITNFSSGMIACDLSSPSEPRLLSELPLSGGATQLAISGQYAFVAAQKTGTRSDGAIHVVDIADPEHPLLKTTVASKYNPVRVTISGHLLFVSDGGMQILDIADPLAPRTVSRLAPGRTIIDIALHGNYAYAATSLGAILVIDISDVNQPVLVNTVLHVGSSDDVEIANGTLFVTAGNAGLLTFDISAPASPTLLGSANPGPPFQSTSVLIRDNYAFITGQFNPGGVRVFDVSDPARLTLAGQLLDSNLILGDSGYSVGLAFAGTNAVFTTGRNAQTRLHVMSFAPSASTRLGTIALPGYSPAKVCLSADNLFYGKFTIDIRDPQHPELISTNSFLALDAVGDSRGIALEGPTLRSFSIEAGATPRLLGATNLSSLPGYSRSGASATLLGDYAYIGTRSAGLLVFDLKAADPVLALQFTNAASITSLAGSSNSLAVTYSRLESNVCCVSTVSLFDLTDPRAPQQVAELTSITNATKAALEDNLLLIADASKALHAFDVSDPTQIVTRGSLQLRAAAESISFTAGIAVVSEGANGYEAFEARAGGNLKRIAGDSSITVSALANRGPMIFAAESSKGLKIATLSNAESPVLSLRALQLNSDGTIQIAIEGQLGNEIVIQRCNDLEEWSDWQQVPAGAPDAVIHAETSGAQTFFRATRK